MPEKATEFSRKSLGYGQRMIEADEVLNSLEKEYTSMGTWQQMSNQYMPSWMKSDKMQQIEQAQRNFVTAVLRQESGAAISATVDVCKQKNLTGKKIVAVLPDTGERYVSLLNIFLNQAILRLLLSKNENHARLLLEI